MTMKVGSLGRLAVCALVGAATAGCGDAGDANGPRERVGTVQSEILNGFDLGEVDVKAWALVAVYHPPKTGTATWHGRPCSGVILRTVNGVSAVLTARHCVTIDSQVDGSIAPVNRIRLMASANPGPANPNPPPSSIQPTSIVGMPVDTNVPRAERDLAIVFANVDWSDRGTYRFGIWVGEPAALAGLPFMAHGYGINVNDQMCDTNGSTQGAGQARRGFDFFVSSGARVGLAGSYTYNNWSTNGQAVMCGDSGGPDHANIGPEEFAWTHIIGVHSSGRVLNEPVQSSVTGMFVQNTLGGSFLSSDFSRDLNVARVDSPLFGPMWTLVHKTDSRGVRVIYDPQTQTIRSSDGRCMQPSGANVLARPCGTTTNQRWTIPQHRWVQNVATGQCLTMNGSSGLAMQNCSFATLELAERQHWAFHPQR